jgi:hypothetical protein
MSEILWFCVSFDDLALVLIFCLSTGIRGGALGSESIIDTVNIIYCHGHMGG